MKTRAAVAFEAKKPLEIVELDLDGPKAGEVLVEIMATGICHTDAYTLDGFDSEGSFLRSSAMRRKHRSRGRHGRDVGEAGRSRDPALHARMPPVQSCLSSKTNLCTAIRAPRARTDAGRHVALSYKGETIFHYMGCSTFSNFTVLPEIAVAKIRKTRRSTRLLHRLRRDHRRRRRRQHRQGHAGSQRGRIRAWRDRTQRHSGRQNGRRRQDHRRPQRFKEEWGRRFGMTHFVNPSRSAATSSSTWSGSPTAAPTSPSTAPAIPP